MFEYRARITAIIDGDTFEASVDLGFHIYFRERFRLLNYAAPEITGPTRAMGSLAKGKLEELIPVGSDVTMTSRKMEKYGCWLADVVWQDGKTLSQHLIELGFGLFVEDGKVQPTFDPTKPYPFPRS